MIWPGEVMFRIGGILMKPTRTPMPRSLIEMRARAGSASAVFRVTIRDRSANSASHVQTLHVRVGQYPCGRLWRIGRRHQLVSGSSGLPRAHAIARPTVIPCDLSGSVPGLRYRLEPNRQAKEKCGFKFENILQHSHHRVSRRLFAAQMRHCHLYLRPARVSGSASS